jgi:hypothetical protein
LEYNAVPNNQTNQVQIEISYPAAIKINVLGATTLVYKDKKFMIRNTNFDALHKEQRLYIIRGIKSGGR